MIIPFEEKLHNFAQYLKEKQRRFLPAEIIEDISDEDILDSYRKNSEDGSDCYTKEQEKSIIMEYESNDSIEKAFENLQHLNHREELEKELIEEFKNFIVPITIEDYKWIDSARVKINKMGIKIEKNKFNDIFIEAISAFPYWILMGNKYYVAEETPGSFYMDCDEYCSMCLLSEMLHKYKTLLGWSLYTYSGDFEEEGTPETYKDRIISHIYKRVQFLIADSSLNETDHLLNSPKLDKVIDKIMEGLLPEVLNIPLISCWVFGKEKAIEEDKKNKESEEVLKQTHEYFCEKYKDYKKSGDSKQFFSHLDTFLKPLSIEQLSIIYESGFPLEDLSTRMSAKINRTIMKYIHTKEK